MENSISFAGSGKSEYNHDGLSNEFSGENIDDVELDKDYNFYRLLVKKNIFKLLDSSRQRRACLWLQKLDDETDKSLKCAYIKLMLVSLQHTEGNLSLFQHGPPETLQIITNSPNSIKELIDSMLVAEKDAVEESDLVQTSAVSSDMTSYATMLATDTLLQAYYARSDYPIDTWNLPEKVDYPVEIRSASKWEKALSYMPAVRNYAIIDEDEKEEVGEAVDEKDGSRSSATENEDDKVSKSQASVETDPMQTEKECRKIMNDEQMVISEFHDFRWYEHSRLDGSLRPLNEFCTEGHTECYYDKTQLDLDEQAVNIVNKVFPGRVRLTLDPEIIYRITGTELKATNPCKVPKFSDHDQTLNIDFSDNAGKQDISNGPADQCSATTQAQSCTNLPQDVCERNTEVVPPSSCDKLKEIHSNCLNDNNITPENESPCWHKKNISSKIQSTSCVKSDKPPDTKTPCCDENNIPPAIEFAYCDKSKTQQNDESSCWHKNIVPPKTKSCSKQTNHSPLEIEPTCCDIKDVSSNIRSPGDKDNNPPNIGELCHQFQNERDCNKSNGAANVSDIYRFNSTNEPPNTTTNSTADRQECRPLEQINLNVTPRQLANKMCKTDSNVYTPINDLALNRFIPFGQWCQMRCAGGNEVPDNRETCIWPQMHASPMVMVGQFNHNCSQLPRPIWGGNQLPPMRSTYREQNDCPPRSRIPIPIPRRIDRPVPHYQGSRLPVPVRGVPCHSPSNNRMSFESSHNSSGLHVSCENPNNRRGTYNIPNDRRGTYNIPQDRRGTYNVSQDRCTTCDVPQDRRGTYNVTQDRRGTYSVPQDRRGTYDLSCQQASTSCCSPGTNKTRTTVTSKTVETTENCCKYAQPNDGLQRPRPDTDEMVNNFLDDYNNAEFVAPRALAVPGCPYVDIDANMSDNPVPRDWQDILDDRSSIGSQPLSIDISPEYNPNHCQDQADDWVLPEAFRDNSYSSSGGPRTISDYYDSRPFGLDDSDSITGAGPATNRRASRAVSTGVLNAGKNAIRRRSFERKTC